VMFLKTFINHCNFCRCVVASLREAHFSSRHAATTPREVLKTAINHCIFLPLRRSAVA